MKKLCFILPFLIIALAVAYTPPDENLSPLQTVAEAGMMTVIASGGSGASVDDCGTDYGTYMMVWTGDHDSGAGYICHTNGTENKNATIDEGATFSTTDIQASGGNVYGGWAVSSNDIISDEEGTIYFTVSFTDDGNTDLDSVTFLEIPDTENSDSYYLYISFNGTPNEVRLNWYDGTNSIEHDSTTTIAHTDTVRIGVAWKVSTDDLGVSIVSVEASPSWEDDSSITMTNWPTDPGFVFVGEHYSGRSSSDTIKLKDLVILSTYKATDPEA